MLSIKTATNRFHPPLHLKKAIRQYKRATREGVIMKMYILIFAFWSGALSDKDSMSVTHAEFNSKETCEAAGKAASQQFSTLMKTAKYVCVEK